MSTHLCPVDAFVPHFPSLGSFPPVNETPLAVQMVSEFFTGDYYL
jgi:hypothetical protein